MAVQRLVEALPGFTVSNQALASLMCSMPIRRDVPQLGLGMILQDVNDEYLLCVQPRCDSVRIEQDAPSLWHRSVLSPSSSLIGKLMPCSKTLSTAMSLPDISSTLIGCAIHHSSQTPRT